jgi:hypothetical protein
MEKFHDSGGYKFMIRNFVQYLYIRNGFSHGILKKATLGALDGRPIPICGTEQYIRIKSLIHVTIDFFS